VVRNGAVYVPLEDLAQGLHISAKYLPDIGSYQLTRAADFLSVTLRLNSRAVYINKTPDVLSAPILLIQDVWYVPLHDVLWTLGYFVKNDDNTYYIVSKITEVTWQEKTIRIQGKAPLTSEVRTITDNCLISIPDCILDMPEKNIPIEDGVIKSIQVRQASLSPAVVLITVSGGPFTYTVLKEDAENALVVRLMYAVPVRPQQVLAAPATTESVSIKKFSAASGQVTWIPEKKLLGRSSLTAVIRGLRYPNIPISWQGTVCYADQELWSALGCEVTHPEPGVSVLSDNDGRAIRVTGTSFPLLQTLRTIGYAAYWADNILYINPRITDMTYPVPGKIVIQSNDRIIPKNPVYQVSPSRMVIDIPYTAYDVSINYLRIHDQFVSMVRGAQFDKGITRIVIDLVTKNQPTVLFENDGKTMIVAFQQQPVLTGLSLYTDAQKNVRATFAVSGGRPNYKIQRLPNPDRLVLTFEQTLMQMKNTSSFSSGPIQRVRASQFSWQPLQSRVVFDVAGLRAYQLLADGSLLLYAGAASVVSTVHDRPTTTHATQTIVQTPEPKIESRVEQKIEPRVEPQIERSLQGLRVAILPGHGGSDAGAISRTGAMEKDYTLDVAKKVQKLLADAGAIPLMCREGDENVTLENQAEFAIRNKADVLISIHFNSFFVERVNGSEAYYYKPIDYALAKAVHEEITKIKGLKNKGLKKAMMHNLNHTTMPGVLVEPLFISNLREEALLKDEDFQWKLAQAIVTGIKRYRSKQ
jgi:N-acetylmuramoyl-L-alanine amidase